MRKNLTGLALRGAAGGCPRGGAPLGAQGSQESEILEFLPLEVHEGSRRVTPVCQLTADSDVRCLGGGCGFLSLETLLDQGRLLA